MQITAGRFDLSRLGAITLLDRPSPDPAQPDVFKLTFASGAVLTLPRKLYYALQSELDF